VGRDDWAWFLKMMVLSGVEERDDLLDMRRLAMVSCDGNRIESRGTVSARSRQSIERLLTTGWKTISSATPLAPLPKIRATPLSLFPMDPSAGGDMFDEVTRRG
jgi:hypothetical protein